MEQVIDEILKYKRIQPLSFWVGIVLILSLFVGLWFLYKKWQQEKALTTNRNYPNPHSDQISPDQSKYSLEEGQSNGVVDEPNRTPGQPDLLKEDENVETREPSISSTVTEYLLADEGQDKLVEEPAPPEPETASAKNKPLRVNYSSNMSEQLYQYPLFRCPDQNTVVRSYQHGAEKRRGYKEAFFQEEVEKYFSESFEVLGNIRLNTGKDTRPFEPDIALISKANKSLRIDIEIDEPYAGISRKPTHCEGDDIWRDLYFTDRGWIVLRFSEYQVHLFEKECLRYIGDVIESILESHSMPGDLSEVEMPPTEKLWNLVQAQTWEKDRYREEYLNHEFEPLEERRERVNRALNEQEQEEENLVQSKSFGIKEEAYLLGYNQFNAHPRDSRIDFYPEAHQYLVDKVPTPSVSSAVAKFFPQFDVEFHSRRMARNQLQERGMEATDDQVQSDADAIARGWREKGERASQKGTHLHEQIEKYFLGESCQTSEEFQFFLQFQEDHPTLNPYRSEWRIFDEKFQIAGTIDLIDSDDRGFAMYDWKRSKKIINIFTDEPIIQDKWGKHGIGALHYIPDTSFNKYCLQQNIYRYILERNYGLEIANMYLIVLHPNYHQYYKLEVPKENEAINHILGSL